MSNTTTRPDPASPAVAAIQWAPSGSAWDGIPSEMVRFLADDDGRTHGYGYGYGPGTAIIFGHKGGDVEVLARQWVVKHEDGTITVTDEQPEIPGNPA